MPTVTTPSDPAVSAASQSPATRPWWMAANCLALMAVAIGLRCWRLDNLPGLNGDEAWSGVQAMRLLHGEEVSWLTPTGNPVNLWYLLPLTVLHAFWSPACWLVRVPAAVSGVLALAANFWLGRRSLGNERAVLSTLLLAVLPVNIAYSRFGWDASQTLLASVVVLHCSLLAVRTQSASRWLLAGAIALAAAILVHPTNVFLAPVLAVAAAWVWRADLRAAWIAPRGAVFRAAAISGGLLATACLAWAARSYAQDAAVRLTAPDQWSAFAKNYGRLFTGATVYEFIPGSLASSSGARWGEIAWHDLLAIFAAGLVLYGLYRCGRRGMSAAEACLAAGWGGSLAAFFVVAGPRALAPHSERYGLCLIAPAVALAAVGLCELCRLPAVGRGVRLAYAATAWCLLLGFQQQYVQFVLQTGGNSHVAFRTGPIEPKRAALQVIRAEAPVAKARIACSSWWMYWPLHYLALGTGADVYYAAKLAQPDYPQPQPADGLSAGPTIYWVEFSGSPQESRLLRSLQAAGYQPQSRTIDDYAGRGVISVWRLPQDP